MIASGCMQVSQRCPRDAAGAAGGGSSSHRRSLGFTVCTLWKTIFFLLKRGHVEWAAETLAKPSGGCIHEKLVPETG